jgi:hypothetical protein
MRYTGSEINSDSDLVTNLFDDIKEIVLKRRNGR